MEYTSDLDNEDSEAYKNAANSIDDFFGDTFQDSWLIMLVSETLGFGWRNIIVGRTGPRDYY